MALHAFHHYDCVVYDQANREHETEQGKRVERKSEEREENERTDQRNRNRQERNQRCTPALQEDVDHNDYKDESDGEGLNDFLDALSY